MHLDQFRLPHCIWECILLTESIVVLGSVTCITPAYSEKYFWNMCYRIRFATCITIIFTLGPNIEREAELVRKWELPELLWHKHQPLTSTLSERGSPHSCPKYPLCPIILIIIIITSFDGSFADDVVVDSSDCIVKLKKCILARATPHGSGKRSSVNWPWSQISMLYMFVCSIYAM